MAIRVQPPEPIKTQLLVEGVFAEEGDVVDLSHKGIAFRVVNWPRFVVGQLVTFCLNVSFCREHHEQCSLRGEILRVEKGKVVATFAEAVPSALVKYLNKLIALKALTGAVETVHFPEAVGCLGEKCEKGFCKVGERKAA